MIVIKKYSNRRLYDTSRSAYITLGQVVELVEQGHALEIVDAKTKEDITQRVLAQVFLEHQQGAASLPVSTLTKLVGLPKADRQQFVQQFIPWALDAYLRSKSPGHEGPSLNPLDRVEPPAAASTQPAQPATNDVADLRSQVEELKALILGQVQK